MKYSITLHNDQGDAQLFTFKRSNLLTGYRAYDFARLMLKEISWLSDGYAIVLGEESTKDLFKPRNIWHADMPVATLISYINFCELNANTDKAVPVFIYNRSVDADMLSSAPERYVFFLINSRVSKPIDTFDCDRLDFAFGAKDYYYEAQASTALTTTRYAMTSVDVARKIGGYVLSNNNCVFPLLLCGSPEFGTTPFIRTGCVIKTNKPNEIYDLLCWTLSIACRKVLYPLMVTITDITDMDMVLDVGYVYIFIIETDREVIPKLKEKLRSGIAYGIIVVRKDPYVEYRYEHGIFWHRSNALILGDSTKSCTEALETAEPLLQMCDHLDDRR